MAKMTLEQLRTLRRGEETGHFPPRGGRQGNSDHRRHGNLRHRRRRQADLRRDREGPRTRKGIAEKVVVRQTGCMGLCYVEPTVEVVMPGMPTVIYGKMTSSVAKELVKKHLVERTLLDNHIFDRPAADIVKK